MDSTGSEQSQDKQQPAGSFYFSGKLKEREEEPWATSGWPGFQLYQGTESRFLFFFFFFNYVIKIYPSPSQTPVHNCLSLLSPNPGHRHRSQYQDPILRLADFLTLSVSHIKKHMHISHVKWQEGLPEPGISTWD